MNANDRVIILDTVPEKIYNGVVSFVVASEQNMPVDGHISLMDNLHDLLLPRHTSIWLPLVERKPIEAYRYVGNELTTDGIHNLVTLHSALRHKGDTSFPHDIPLVPIVSPPTKTLLQRRSNKIEKSADAWTTTLRNASLTCLASSAFALSANSVAVTQGALEFTSAAYLLAMPLTCGTYLGFTLMLGQCALIKARKKAYNRQFAKSDYARLLSGAFLTSTLTNRPPDGRLKEMKPAVFAK